MISSIRMVRYHKGYSKIGLFSGFHPIDIWFYWCEILCQSWPVVFASNGKQQTGQR